jgi:hypothetical protein
MDFYQIYDHYNRISFDCFEPLHLLRNRWPQKIICYFFAPA